MTIAINIHLYLHKKVTNLPALLSLLFSLFLFTPLFLFVFMLVFYPPLTLKELYYLGEGHLSKISSFVKWE